YAVRSGVPLTPRAAGTNLTGSAIGSGIILDVSRLNRILEINREEQWARVQPGIVLAELNKQLARDGIMFGPDPSSGDMCKLGGMLANNSAGPHTLRYGSVKDNVHAVRIYLQAGQWLDARPYALDDPRLNEIQGAYPAIRDVLNMVRTHGEMIRSKRPTVSKNSCGYNLFGLVDGLDRSVCDLPKLFVGSEGTLGVMSEATIRLVPRPKVTTTALIHFRSLDEVGEAVFKLLSLSPSALEVMDGNTLNLIGRDQHGIPADAEATLIAEFDETDEPSMQIDYGYDIRSMCRAFRLAADPILAFSQEQREQIWKARKALYPTLYRYGNGKKPINYVDDVVVRAERIGELVRYLEGFFKHQRVPVAIFGHIGNGNAHIVPLLDVNDQEDFARMVEGYHAIHEAVLTRFDGSICGEHGDGRVRAEYVRRMFGDELYGLFKAVKQSFDPGGVLNPGVKISEAPFTEHIDYTRLSKECATCGKCNSVCPIYDVFQSEDMSSRGWFEIVTAKDYSYLNSKRVVEACLNCKSCRTICPADVDVSDLILKRRAEHPNYMAGLIFKFQARPTLFDPVLKLLGNTQWFWDRPSIRALIEYVTRPLMRRVAATARIPRDMVLPKLAGTHLPERYPELVRNGQTAEATVAYFHGCAAKYFDDGVGDAVIRVLRQQGIEPALPFQRCSGTPIQTYGHVDLAKDGARFNLASFEPYETIVTGCASCTLMLKDYPKLFAGEPEEEAAKRLSKKVKHVTEMGSQSRVPRKSETVTARPCKVTYHSSCHLRAAGVTKAPRHVLYQLPGIEFVEMQDADRCAGGAGTYLLKDYDTSQKIFDRKRRAIEESGADVVATSCPACLIQLKNGLRGKVAVKHVAEVMSESNPVETASGKGTPSHS
ncbi:MAG TPA: FAD-binding and (Fe-S)-binding domain-containing protein, partial [Nitrospiraceae bacterium]|nr:FAD-binding and (Fe-S)-binding domain-containing protein [Nitrospiraceae bacterium]